VSIDHFINLLDAEGRRVFTDLNSPFEIQAYLDSIPYSIDYANHCPLSVLRLGKAHCLDGALLAAVALHRLGNPPLLIDMYPEPGTDDDHVLAIFQVGRHYGAIAKSNYPGLRFREAVYRSTRELVMSYFNDFFNLRGEKTLRFYTAPLNLARLDALEWMWKDSGADAVEQCLLRLRKIPVVTSEMVKILSPLDKRSLQAGMLGVNPDGLYRPQAKR